MDTDHGAVSPYSIGSDRNLVPVKSRGTLFKTAKRHFTKIILALAFLVVMLLIIVIVLAVISSKARPTFEVCNSEECIRIAASLKQSMNTSVNPCDDFYEYTCGRWSREHPTPDSSTTNSWFSERTMRVTRIIRELIRKNTTTETPWAVIQAKKLYASCIDIVSLNNLGLWPLQNLLEELNLPEIPAIFSGQPGNIIEQLATVKKTLGRDIFFGLDIFPDPRNKTRNIMSLGVPSMNSPLPSNKELDKRLQRIKSRMRNVNEDSEDEDDDAMSVERIYMMDVIREVTSNGTTEMCNSDRTTSPNDTEIVQIVEEIYQMSGKIYFLTHDDANDTAADEEIRDEDYMFVDDLQKLTDEYVKDVNFSLTPRKIWRPFIEELLKDYPGLDLTKKDKVLVEDLDYLKQVAVLMSDTDDVLLGELCIVPNLTDYQHQATIWWNVLDTVAPHSSENLRRAWAVYLHSITSVEVWESRSLHCANSINQLMGMAVSWLFVDPNFHENIGPKVVEMLEDIRAAFAALVMRADWMDEKTKIATLEKSKKMASVIGHPNWLFAEGELNEYYEGINMSEDAYLDNMLQIVKLTCIYELRSLHERNPENETYWATDPTDVNAFHTFQANQITSTRCKTNCQCTPSPGRETSNYKIIFQTALNSFNNSDAAIPAGILQFPFYELGLEALNYGAIGTVLGHELTHGFDNSGRQFDSIGNMRQWWSNETIHEYTVKTQCFVEHYNTYYEEKVDDYIDGELTLGENIADNGGLREAVWAYRKWKARHGVEKSLPGFAHFSSEQLLFLAFGHIWCESYTSASLKWMLMDTHCPGHVRLVAVIKNSREFSDAWKCPVGSAMNPKKKCHLW